MRLLLDTHVFLWSQLNPSEIRKTTRQLIEDADLVFVSVASAWEAAIKIGLGKLRLPEPFLVGVEKSGFQPLPIQFAHTERVATLPRLHGDPFDRMLVAQAEVEMLTIVTRNSAIERYQVDVIPA